ncbi:hypothetical protein, partial [Paraburkholderia sp. DGU8]|uniref:hypothetical protein n=1 Tax=Paraburkholderia sp. DGU8 TaxID=3161997 RepID=UPI003467DD67
SFCLNRESVKSVFKCGNRLNRKNSMRELFVAVRFDPSIRHLTMQIESSPAVMRLDTGPGEPELLLIRCEQVISTGYGFLQLVPHKPQRGRGSRDEMDWFALPPSVVAWVAESPPSTFSFGEEDGRTKGI